MLQIPALAEDTVFTYSTSTLKPANSRLNHYLNSYLIFNPTTRLTLVDKLLSIGIRIYV